MLVCPNGEPLDHPPVYIALAIPFSADFECPGGDDFQNRLVQGEHVWMGPEETRLLARRPRGGRRVGADARGAAVSGTVLIEVHPTPTPAADLPVAMVCDLGR